MVVAVAASNGAVVGAASNGAVVGAASNGAVAAVAAASSAVAVAVAVAVVAAVVAAMRRRRVMALRMYGVVALAIGLSLAALPNRPALADGMPASAATGAQTFATADEGVEKLAAAVRVDDRTALRAVLGPGSEKLLNSGDKVLDAQRRARFLADYDERHELAAADEPDRMILKVGNNRWSLPIPLVQVNGQWHFDSAAGAQELINRWIGR